MQTNVFSPSQTIFSTRLGSLLQALSAPARLDILRTIGMGEACVCHLEAVLGQRQAYISQQLMALRDAGLIESRRDGRFIYYRLSDPRVLDLLRLAAGVAGLPEAEVDAAFQPQAAVRCECPKCQLVQIAVPDQTRAGSTDFADGTDIP